VARRVDVDVDEAAANWQAVQDLGISVDEVGDKLEAEGVSSFTKSFDELIASLDTKATSLRS
jgi:transaldolase